jgi:hypothetical protein
MYAMLTTGQCSRRVALLPLDVIERIRAVVHDPNAALKKDQKELNDLFVGLRKTLGSDKSGRLANAVRIGWRVGVAVAALGFYIMTMPATPAYLLAMSTAGTWMYMHLQLFKKWRGYDDQRVIEALKMRKKGRRGPRDKPVREQAARFVAWTLFAAFAPAGFVAETIARVGRNIKVHHAKNRVERKRDQLDVRIKERKDQIEQMAAAARRSHVLELPENVPPTPAAYDTYYHQTQTPPAQVAPPVPTGGGRGMSAADDDPDQRRRGAGSSLI